MLAAYAGDPPVVNPYMPRPLTLVHLTDLHLLAEATARLHGWQVQAALDAVVADIHARLGAAVHAYVLGGDLVDDESTPGYARLNRQLATWQRPVLAMAGNHDDPATMARILTHAHVHTPLRLADWSLIALDSHRCDSEAGRLGSDQLARLEQCLRENERPTLLFVHHPPCDLGSAWIDSIGLVDRDALARVMRAHAHVRGVVCGHAHQAATLEFAGRPCVVTPATMRQFLPGAREFAEDEQRAPGYRTIELTANGTWRSQVRRVNAARRACG